VRQACRKRVNLLPSTTLLSPQQICLLALQAGSQDQIVPRHKRSTGSMHTFGRRRSRGPTASLTILAAFRNCDESPDTVCL
jgi:hypothetical protein